jgi:hypothetical protein
MFAMKSREHVLAHEKFNEIFGKYADAIGINKEQSYPEWDEMKVKLEKIEEDRKKAEEEKKIKEEQAKIEAEIKRKEELLLNR